ncbi:hypothetical protein EQI52_06150 [Leuconostoc mesenteroides]|uniref:hypothetical protein n=1 Tax=Leuconostoc mesenteroides TaxID=1245 RepID=UPI000FFCD528|nr:hypothetical protein [Leuconostoc mesenteroides]QAR69391.1 hypothetical protein EQI52_06150 [Leuconostoc mesenteroides]WJM73879.1 hypothetical protein QTN54_03690 [Leuconostoc mesenteroides]
MTFDEALNELEQRTIWSGEMRDLLEQLREEYAPTVEMPAEGKKYFDSAKKYPDEQLFDSFAIFDSNSKREMQTMLGTDDIRGLTNGYQTMAGSFAKNSESTDEIMKKYTVPFMQAWLHPETIKVVDE